MLRATVAVHSHGFQPTCAPCMRACLLTGGKQLMRHLQGMESPFAAARYHSLVIDKDTCPDELEVTAWTEDGTIMAVRHRTYPHIQARAQECCSPPCSQRSAYNRATHAVAHCILAGRRGCDQPPFE